MAYTALYRRLRPQKFSEVIGQEFLIKTLMNQIKTGRINHAYLFCGTRGTGKTSTAKILARAINCVSEDGEKPCNECSVCKNILEGRSLNVVEIDAASNNGVDNIRDIVEEVKYPPTEGKYKVYIIDEVHMLSTGAFNALLKTLEEPPAHVVFILATTDPQKLPVTILSRCQRFDFHRITSKEMAQELKKDMANEGVAITDDALDYVARISDGAMRDALSILDRCMSYYYGEEITVEKITDIMGTVDNEVLFSLTDNICNGDCGGCLAVIDEATKKGREPVSFVNDMVVHFRNLLLAVSVGDKSEALDYSRDYIERLKEQGTRVSYEYILQLISDFSELLNNMRYAANPRVLFEVACIKACTPVTENSSGAIEKRLENLEKAVEKGITVAASVPVGKPEEEKAPEEIKKIIENAAPDDVKRVMKEWKNFANSIESPFLRATLYDNVEAKFLNDDMLTLVCDKPIHLAKCRAEKNAIKDEMARYFEKVFEFKVMSIDEYQRASKETYGIQDNSLQFKDAREELDAKLKGIQVEYLEDMAANDDAEDEE